MHGQVLMLKLSDVLRAKGGDIHVLSSTKASDKSNDGSVVSTFEATSPQISDA